MRQVSDIIAGISAASAEQSSGIAQIHMAVSQMDEATQQNASMVEEGAAASEDLQMRAQTLQDLVRRFVIDAGAGVEAAAVEAAPRRAALAYSR